MLIYIPGKQLKEILMAASQWLTETLALINTVATGSGTDQATKDAVASLKTQLDANDASDTEFKTAITALITKLQNAPAPQPSQD